MRIVGGNAPTQQVSARVEVLNFGNERAKVNGVEFGLDTNAGPHVHNGLANFFVIHVAIVRAVKGKFKAIGVASVSQHFLGAFNVYGCHSVHFCCMTIHARGDDQACWNGKATHDAALDGYAVNGHAQSFANTDILEWILAFGAVFQLVATQVQTKENGSNFWAVQHRQCGCTAQTSHVLRGQVSDGIYVASQKCSNAGRVRFDRRVDDVSHIALELVPPGFVMCHDQFLVGLPFFDDIRACAVGIV